MTIGDSPGWGYVRHNPNMKSPVQLIQNLVTAAVGEGNYLLNCGPRPDGVIRKEEARRLRVMGAWLMVHGEAIYGSQRCELSGGIIGSWTRKENVAYFLIFRWPGEETVVPLVATEPLSATVLATSLRAQARLEKNGRLILSGLPKYPPNRCLNVIKVRFDGEPKRMPEENKAAWLTGQAQ